MINWQRSNINTEYFQHDNFIFKKRDVAGRYVYLIYDGEILLHDTDNYNEFLRRKDDVLKGECV